MPDFLPDLPPDLAIVDAHVHLWDPTHFAMPWLADDPTIGVPFGPVEFREHTLGVPVEAYVYLEVDVAPHYALLEVEWAVARAAEDPRLSAIVAHAPVEYGARCRAYLDALTAISPLVKGVRRLIQGEPDPGFCLRPEFIHGVKLLPDYGLSFDLCITHTQLPSVIGLVRQCPEVDFVLDHIGKPDIAAHLLDPWREGIRDLAQFPNVSCKISGMVTEADHAHWTPDDLAPYVAHVLASFGEDRVLFGGDWPVALRASTYPRWVETLAALTADLPDTAKHKLWADNTRRFYRLV